MFSPSYLASILSLSLLFETVFADTTTNLFFDDPVLNDPFLDATNIQDLFLSDDTFFSQEPQMKNLVADLPDEEEDLWDYNADANANPNNNANFLLSSSCIIDENGQQQQQQQQTPLRARDDDNTLICSPRQQQNTPPPINLKLPDFNDVENALEQKPVRSSSSSSGGSPSPNRPTGPYLPLVLTHSDYRTVYGNEPEYYCNLAISSITRPAPYLLPVPPTVPVCGSGRAADRYGSGSGIGKGKKGVSRYGGVFNGRLIFPGPSWECPGSEFFCCNIFEPADGSPIIDTAVYHRMIDNQEAKFDEGIGRGEECKNLKEAGWRGYDSDKEKMFPKESPEDLGIVDP